MSFARSWLVCVALCMGVLGAWGAAVPDNNEPVPQALRDRILEIARDYQKYGRVDDEFRWAPWLCRMPSPGRVYLSSSKDAETHGQKLYSLFAKDRQHYVALASGKEPVKVPIGQIIVKEAWAPEEMKAPPQRQQLMKQVQLRQVPAQIVVQGQGAQIELGQELLQHVDHFSPYAQKDGKWYHATKKSGLYIMMKVDPGQAGTDQGWIYGTVSADGKNVTGAGKMASCMSCHEKARHDRLFGLRAD